MVYGEETNILDYLEDSWQVKSIFTASINPTVVNATLSPPSSMDTLPARRTVVAMENREEEDLFINLAVVNTSLSPLTVFVVEPNGVRPSFFPSLALVEGFFNTGTVFSPSGVVNNENFFPLDHDATLLGQTLPEIEDFLNAGWSKPLLVETKPTLMFGDSNVEDFFNSLLKATEP